MTRATVDALIDTNITNKTSPNSITPAIDGATRKAVTAEMFAKNTDTLDDINENPTNPNNQFFTTERAADSVVVAGYLSQNKNSNTRIKTITFDKAEMRVALDAVLQASGNVSKDVDTNDNEITITGNSFSISDSTLTDLADDDFVYFTDTSDNNARKKITWANFKTAIGSVGGSGLFSANDATITSLADGDFVHVQDASDSNNPKKITVANFFAGRGTGPTPTYRAPTISRFIVEGINDPSGTLRIPASGTAFGGNTLIRYTTTNSNEYPRKLELLIDEGTGTFVSQAIDLVPNDNGASSTEDLDNFTFQGGRQYRFRLLGNNTQGGQFMNDIVFTVAQVQRDNVYFVTDPTTTPPGITGATALQWSGNTLSTRYPVFTENSYIYYYQPSADPDVNSWIVDGLEQIGTVQKLTQTDNVGGTLYEIWRTNNRLLPSALSNHPVRLGR